MSFGSIRHKQDCGRQVDSKGASVGYSERKWRLVKDEPRHFHCETCDADGPELPIHLTNDQIMSAFPGEGIIQTADRVRK